MNTCLHRAAIKPVSELLAADSSHMSAVSLEAAMAGRMCESGGSGGGVIRNKRFVRPLAPSPALQMETPRNFHL
uniref:Uncharacterized protein n=1 Tax=Knipowitschia caucasica TaxID=637954 RepID=A0AAV2K4Y7_KNICA